MSSPVGSLREDCRKVRQRAEIRYAGIKTQDILNRNRRAFWIAELGRIDGRIQQLIASFGPRNVEPQLGT